MATYSRAWPEVFIELESDPLDAPDPGDWIDVTRWVQRLSFKHGRGSASDDFQPGQGLSLIHI